MRKSLLLLLLPLFLTACAVDGPPQPSHDTLTCLENGKTTVNIFYGDSQLKVIPPLAHVKKTKMIHFILHPDKKPVTDPEGVNYDDVIVTITGKNTDSNWLNVSGNKSGGMKLQVCAPATAGTYSYLVAVQSVGQLDPRAEVDPN